MGRVAACKIVAKAVATVVVWWWGGSAGDGGGGGHGGCGGVVVEFGKTRRRRVCGVGHMGGTGVQSSHSMSVVQVFGRCGRVGLIVLMHSWLPPSMRKLQLVVDTALFVELLKP